MNKTYLVSYDLPQPGRDYKRLHDALKSYGGWAHVLESTWVIQTQQSVSEVRDHLAKFMDSNDKLFVTRQTSEWASRNLKQEVVEWLKKHVTSYAGV